MTIDREHVLAKLREQREHIEREYGLRMIGLVGSVARGEATEESDIDVIVDVIGRPSLFRSVRRRRGVEAGGRRWACRWNLSFVKSMRPRVRASSWSATSCCSDECESTENDSIDMLQYAGTAIEIARIERCQAARSGPSGHLLALSLRNSDRRRGSERYLTRRTRELARRFLGRRSSECGIGSFMAIARRQHRNRSSRLFAMICRH